MDTATLEPPVKPPMDPTPSSDGTTTSERLGLGKMFDDLAKNAAVKAETTQPAPEIKPAEETPAAPPETTPPAAEVTPPAETTPTTPTPEAKPEDEELRTAREIVADPHLSKKQKRLSERYIKQHEERENERKTWEEERTRLAKEKEEANTTAQSRADYDEVKKRAADAEAERDRYRAAGIVAEAETDPAFQQKFAEKENRYTTDIESTLRGIKMAEKPYKFTDDDGIEREGVSIELIRNSGGMVNFARSNPGIYRALLAKLDELDPISADAIRRNVGNLADLQREKEREISAIKANPKIYAESRQKAQQQQEQLRAQQQEQANKALAAHRESEFQRHEAFKILPIPDKASAEEKSRIEGQNKLANENRNKLTKLHEIVFGGKATPQDLAEGTLRAILYEAEHQVRTKLEEENKTLKAENARLRQGGIIKPAGTVPAPASSRPAAQPVKEVEGEKAIASSVLDLATKMANDRAKAQSGNLN